MIRALFPRKGAHADALKALATINPSKPKSAFSDLAPVTLVTDLSIIFAHEANQPSKIPPLDENGKFKPEGTFER